jgi:hypothetical protein
LPDAGLATREEILTSCAKQGISRFEYGVLTLRRASTNRKGRLAKSVYYRPKETLRLGAVFEALAGRPADEHEQVLADFVF